MKGVSTEPFTIDCVGWHTSTPGNTETREDVVRRFFAFVSFLQQHNLVVRNLASREADIDDAFSIRSSDLTEDGLALAKVAYDKWLSKIDSGMDPSNFKIFERELSRVRHPD